MVGGRDFFCGSWDFVRDLLLLGACKGMMWREDTQQFVIHTNLRGFRCDINFGFKSAVIY
jgi:hypothetical protein